MNTYEVYLSNGVVRRIEAFEYSSDEEWMRFRNEKTETIYRVQSYLVEEVITNPENGHVTTYSEPTPEAV